MFPRLSLSPNRWRLGVECLLLALGLLMSAGAAQAFFSEAVSPPSARTVYGPYGCEGSCTGSCSWDEVDNGNDCATGCPCCGCQTYWGVLGVYSNTGAGCYPNGDQSCECAGGQLQFTGLSGGWTATTVSDCG